MAVMVLSRIGHELSRRVIGSTLAGDGLLVRIRSISIGLLGLVAAIGLGLVAFVSNQGWPDVLSSPIPAGPPRVSAVHDAVALGPGVHAPAARPARRLRATALRAGGHTTGGRSGPSGDSGLRGAREVADAPSPAQTTPAPVAPQPPGVPGGVPTGQGTEGVPTSTGAPAAAPVASSSKPEDSRHGAAKAKSHDAGGSESHSSAPAKPKPKAHSPAKSSHSHHAEAPTPQTAAAEAPPSSDGAPAEEAHGKGHAAGKSDKGH